MAGGLFAPPPLRPPGILSSPRRARPTHVARSLRRPALLLAATFIGAVIVTTVGLLGWRTAHVSFFGGAEAGRERRRSLQEKWRPAAAPSSHLLVSFHTQSAHHEQQQPTPSSSSSNSNPARDRALARLAALPGMSATPLSALAEGGGLPAGALPASLVGAGGGLLSAAAPRVRRTQPTPPLVADGLAVSHASAALISSTLRDALHPPPSPPQPRFAAPPPLPARRAAVRAAFAHTWAGYVAHAWGSDELAPVSREGYASLCGQGVTILDSLDTLALLGFPGELGRAREWVAGQDWTSGRPRVGRGGGGSHSSSTTTPADGTAGCVASTFEATIRCLGGLVSAWDLTGDALFLEAASGLAGRLAPAFDTPSGLPAPSVLLVPPLAAGGGGGAEEEEVEGDGDDDNAVGPDSPSPHGPPRTTYLAEAGSVQLEWVRLAAAVGRLDWAAMAERAVATILDATPGGDEASPGLFPTTLSLATGAGVFPAEAHTVAGRADSFYECLLKAWLLRRKGGAPAPAGDRPVKAKATAAGGGATAGRHAHALTTPGGPAATERLRAAWEAAMDAVLDRLVGVCPRTGAPFLTTDGGERATDHLACFLPGNLAQGVSAGAVGGPKAARYLEAAVALATTCFQTANGTATGLAPETTIFTPAGPTPGRAAASLLRPEVVESLWLLRAATGNATYADWGWELFTAWERHAKVPTGGYSGVVDVEPGSPGRAAPGPVAWDDQQPSWWPAETLKYFYLLFGDEVGGDGSSAATAPLDGPGGLLHPPGEWVFTTEAHPVRVLAAGGRV